MKSRKLISAIAPFLFLCAAVTSRAGNDDVHRSPHAVKGEYIVVLNDDTPQDKVPGVVKELTAKHGGSVQRIWQYAVKGYFVTMTEGQAQGLSHNPKVKYVEENAEVFLSSTPTRISTYRDPGCPGKPGCTVITDDNRLWHLDSLDQPGSAPSGDYASCDDGSGVYVYVIDSGVRRAHREFSDNPARVLDGYDAGDDGPLYPAYDPCRGGDPPLNPQRHNHGNGAASMVAGNQVGVARGANIVPIKIRNCATDAAKELARNTPYSVGETVTFSGSLYICRTAGTTGPTAVGFPIPQGKCAEGTGLVDGAPQQPGVPPPACFDLIQRPADALESTMRMVVEGIDWILSPFNPNPTHHQVATFSLHYGPADATQTFTIDGGNRFNRYPTHIVSLEDAVRNLINADITVIASANNQNGDACDSSPARLSRYSPLRPPPGDAAYNLYKVITVGGTMLLNNPDGPSLANGGVNENYEPIFDKSKPVKTVRWVCTAGDSDVCSATSQSPPNPADPGYAGLTAGSNTGQCVTLYAPAKNIPVATLSESGYRNPRGSGPDGYASGTSWSAPMVAGVAAMILSAHPMYGPDDVYDELMRHYSMDIDPATFNAPGIQPPPPRTDGSPDWRYRVLRFPDVSITGLTVDNNARTVSVSAASKTGSTAFSYQWFKVDPLFNVNAYPSDAYVSATATPPVGTSMLFHVPTDGGSFFARVRSDCGSADSDIRTFAAISAPQAPVITARTSDGNSRAVHISWNLVSGATSYRIDRATCPGANCWAQAAVIDSGTVSSYDDTPPLVTGQPVTAYLYRVVALANGSASSPSAIDFATTSATLFAEPIGTNGATVIKCTHVKELRNAIDAVRVAGGLSPSGYGWTGWPASYANTTGSVYAADVGAMRRALDEAMYALNNSHLPTTANPSGSIMACHFTDLREAVR